MLHWIKKEHCRLGNSSHFHSTLVWCIFFSKIKTAHTVFPNWETYLWENTLFGITLSETTEHRHKCLPITGSKSLVPGLTIWLLRRVYSLRATKTTSQPHKETSQSLGVLLPILCFNIPIDMWRRLGITVLYMTLFSLHLQCTLTFQSSSSQTIIFSSHTLIHTNRFPLNI